MKKSMIPLMVFVLLLGLLGVELLHSKYGLTTTTYTLESTEVTEPIRIVQLTDLHNSVFGENNSRLINAVSGSEPDLIFITGDLVNSHDGSDTAIATSLITELSSIAPVYFSYGNQEKDMEARYGTDITGVFTDAGAIVLDYSYLETEVKNQQLRIGGVYGYCMPLPYAIETKRNEDNEFMMDFQDTSACTLLLCHMPVCWVQSGSLYDWETDYIFSGHAHGGQIRIPFIGGLWAPDQGWFPGEESGVYTTTEDNWKETRQKFLEFSVKHKYDTSYYEKHTEYSPSSLVLSRGLGNTEKVPRFNNVPEIVVVDLVPQ